MVTLPIWLVVIVAALAIFAFVNNLFLPVVRWVLRRRINRMIEDVNSRLSLQLPTFQITKRKVLIDRLTYDPEVMAAVDQAAARTDMPRSAVMSLVATYAREMVPAFNAYFYFRVGIWIFKRILRTFYHVRLGRTDEGAYNAFAPNTSIVLIMNHRSNVDYLLVTYLASRNTTLSVGAGEWARVWPFNQLMRIAGAYILRRDAGDPLYRKVLERYVQMATEAGVPHAVFAEGQLSRDGSVGEAKYGMLGYITKKFDPTGSYDIMFVPVGVNYDWVLESETLVKNVDTDFRGSDAKFVLGSFFRTAARNFRFALANRKTLLGTASASFGPAISFKDWLAKNDIDYNNLSKPDWFKVVARLADDIMVEIGKVVPALSVPIVANVVSGADTPLTELEIKVRAQKLMLELSACGVHIAIQEGAEDAAIDSGLQTLVKRDLVTIDANGLIAANPDRLDMLYFCARSIAHFPPAADNVPADHGTQELHSDPCPQDSPEDLQAKPT